MSAIFSASTDTGYKVVVDKPTAAGLVPLRIERKIHANLCEQITINLPAHTANMLSSILEDVAVRAYAVELGKVVEK